ncbi:MAG: bifunctional phosphoglucose/phosphomannose isomerase [Patescibacteria group bacterium]
MASVDSMESISKIDQEGFLQCIQEFPDQVERAWKDWKEIPLPTRFIQAKNILLVGMGGSSIGGAIAMGLAHESSIPMQIWRDYGLPDWVSKDTLVIATSYSGNTEETLDCVNKAALKTDKIITICAGGELDVLSRKYRTTHYKVNYSGQPRAAMGFLMTAVLAAFSKLKLIDLSDDDVSEAIILARALQKKIDANVPTPNNNAKLFALKLQDRIPVIIGSGTLAAVARRWTIDFNENAKYAAYFQELPEMNHNALVGTEFPKNLGQKIFVLVLMSKFDHPRNQIRENTIIQVFQKRRIPCETFMFEPAPTPLAEVLQFAFFSAYTSFYLAMLNDSDPSQIEMVNFLKEKLAEKPMD